MIQHGVDISRGQDPTTLVVLLGVDLSRGQETGQADVNSVELKCALSTALLTLHPKCLISSRYSESRRP